MLETYETKRSWVTQRLANRFPPWSRLRQLSQSYGQMMLEPMGRELENWYWWENYNLGNHLVNTSDLNQIQGIRRLSLPPSFNFRTRSDSDSLVYLPPSLVKAFAGEEEYSLTQAYENKLEDFWYGIPSRVDAAGESHSYFPIVPQTTVASLSSVAPKNISVPGKLFITLANNGASVKNYHGIIARSSIELVGRDIYGSKVRERVFFTFNGTVITKRGWSEIETIETNYIDETATVRVDWLPVGNDAIFDPSGLSISTSREKFRFFSLNHRGNRSFVQHLKFSASDFNSVQDGDDSKDPDYEVELLRENGNMLIGANWLSQWPNRRWLVVTEGSHAHFYPTAIPSPDLSPLARRTTDPILQIETDKEWCYPTETVTLDYNLKRPFWQVLRTRWSVEKPDGSIFGINPEGQEVTYSESGWVDNEAAARFDQVGFQGETVDYNLSSRGRYIFFLEAIIKNPLDGVDKPAFRQLDAKVVSSAALNAEASVQLPVSVGTSAYLTFDSYGRPWSVSDTGTAHRLQFHYDKYLVDFDNKVILTREDYDYLEVDA